MEIRFSIPIKKAAAASCLAGGFAAALYLFLFDPSRFPVYPVCLFHRLTGLDCPGCGGLRAIHHLLHGNLAAAFHFNAFFVLSLPLFACVAILAAWRRMNNKPAAVVIRPVWLWLYLAAFVAFGVLRNLPFPFFAAFAP
jgi:hypothetical protein